MIKKDKDILPNNFLAEKSILSTLLINSDSIEFIVQALKVEAFYYKNHQEIYRAILAMNQKSIPVDIVTLYSFLQDNGLLTNVGGIDVLLELVNQVPSLVYFHEYVRLLNDKFLRRSLIKLGYKIINSSYIMNLALEDVVEDLENQIFNLSNQARIQKISTGLEILTSIFLELKEKSSKSSFPGLKSGFNNLDSITQGLQKSDLVIVAGRPSMGKTALCLNIATNIVKMTSLPVLFFSLEMSKIQLMYRVLSSETNINQTQLKMGQLSKKDWVKIRTVIKTFSRLPFFIDDSPNLTISDIKSKIKQIIFDQNTIGLVIIDYLQLMESSDLKIENRAQELSYITRSLKRIAREFDIPVIALSQLSRKVENRPNKRPILSDLKESGSIEQDADLVLMLYREDYYNKIQNLMKEEKLSELIIAKHRNGPTGLINLKFNESLIRFLNVD